MRPTRRAFLLGRSNGRAQAAAPELSPGDAFALAVSRALPGRVTAAAAGVLRLRPLDDDEMRQAMVLCAQHGAVVTLAAAAASMALPLTAFPRGLPRGAPARRPALEVDVTALDSLRPDAATPGGWRAAPGVRMGMLADVGLAGFAGLPRELTLAHWFAQGEAAGAMPGATPPPGAPAAGASHPAQSAPWAAIHAAEVLLGDGGEHWLGPFGAQGGQPLHHPQLRELVSALFALAGSAEAQQCLASPAWPGRYRLDALAPRPPAQPNLARLLAGHGAGLVWVQALILRDAAPAPLAIPAPAPLATPAPACSAPADGVGAAAARLDARIKQLFDPWDRFPV